MIKTGFLNAQKLPVLIEPDDRLGSTATSGLLDFVLKTNGDFLRKKLLTHGAILFRGFRIHNVPTFKSLVYKFSGKSFFDYAGGVSPRIPIGRGAYTSTEYPSHLGLSLHNEMSYSDVFPKHLYFCCLTAPREGGETTLGDSRRILSKINPKTAGLFKHKKIRYERILSGEKGNGYSWQEAFGCDDRKTAEEICRKIGAQVEWKENGFLHLSQIRPSTAFHDETNEEVWFNQADGFHPSNLDEETYRAQNGNFRLNADFGDGSPICSLSLDQIREVLRSETVSIKWQTGDFLIVDNLLTAHGRNPFAGERKIALAMT